MALVEVVRFRAYFEDRATELADGLEMRYEGKERLKVSGVRN